MASLFLTSSGITPALEGAFLTFVHQGLSRVRVAFIPTAGDIELSRHYLRVEKDRLAQMGFVVETVDLKSHDPESLARTLDTFDVIFVNGGNTFYLLDWAKRSGFDQFMASRQGKQKLYVGVSAGSILAGPRIDPAGWEPYPDLNLPRVSDLTALGLVPFGISPHFMTYHHPYLVKYSQTVKYPIVALYDGQAVMVSDDKITLLGAGEKIFLNNFQETIPISDAF